MHWSNGDTTVMPTISASRRRRLRERQIEHGSVLGEAVGSPARGARVGVEQPRHRQQDEKACDCTKFWAMRDWVLNDSTDPGVKLET